MNHLRNDSLIFEKDHGVADRVEKKWIEGQIKLAKSKP
jgi:hypothetical protein